VIAVADLVLFGTAMILVHGIRRWMGTIGVDAFAILIDSDEVLRFEAPWRQMGGKELLSAAHDSWSRPQLVWRFIQ
jgi:hypothetical protein